MLKVRRVIIIVCGFLYSILLNGQCSYNLNSYTHIDCYGDNAGTIDISIGADGVVAAKAAKMKCIAVPDEVDYKKPQFAIADQLLKSLKDFDLNSILGW